MVWFYETIRAQSTNAIVILEYISKLCGPSQKRRRPSEEEGAREAEEGEQGGKGAGDTVLPLAFTRSRAAIILLVLVCSLAAALVFSTIDTSADTLVRRISEIIMTGRSQYTRDEGRPNMAIQGGACECDTKTEHASGILCPSCNRPTHDATTKIAEIEIPPILNPDGTSITYDLDQSTEQNYQILSYNYTNCTGLYSSIRFTLDYTYHSHYHPQRQRIQDAIVTHLLNRTAITCSTTGRSCSAPHDGNWIVFTAGAFGAGKTHTIRTLSQRNRFPLAGFVQVDPDEIRRHLPEFHYYVDHDAEGAGEMTRKEAGELDS